MNRATMRQPCQAAPKVAAVAAGVKRVADVDRAAAVAIADVVSHRQNLTWSLVDPSRRNRAPSARRRNHRPTRVRKSVPAPSSLTAGLARWRQRAAAESSPALPAHPSPKAAIAPKVVGRRVKVAAVRAAVVRVAVDADVSSISRFGFDLVRPLSRAHGIED